MILRIFFCRKTICEPHPQCAKARFRARSNAEAFDFVMQILHPNPNAHGRLIRRRLFCGTDDITEIFENIEIICRKY